jgi:hypothetical protein
MRAACLYGKYEEKYFIEVDVNINFKLIPWILPMSYKAPSNNVSFTNL